MKCITASLMGFALLLFTAPMWAQGTTSQATASCNFDSQNQLAVEYQRFSVKGHQSPFGHQIPYDKVWTPGGKPLTLFTNSPVAIAGHNLSPGAYTMFLVPDEKAWTLVVSKSTDMSGQYDKSKDVARIPMDMGTLPSPENQFSVYFGHTGPQQCSMMVDLGNKRGTANFNEAASQSAMKR